MAEKYISKITLPDGETYTLKGSGDASNKMDKENPTGTGSFSLNRKTGTTIGNYSFAEGINATASGDYSHAEGYYTKAIGQYSHAEGDFTQAEQNSCHAEGHSTVASGISSHAEGVYTTASGHHSHAEGYYSKTVGERSHAEGDNTAAFGQCSHAEGYHSKTSMEASHAEGYQTIASGIGAHAEGRNTFARDSYSHAEGYNTITRNAASHAEGAGTFATGSSSHAENEGTKSSGIGSHSEGYYTVATGNYQHVQGKYNIADVNGTTKRSVDIFRGDGVQDTLYFQEFVDSIVAIDMVTAQQELIQDYTYEFDYDYQCVTFSIVPPKDSYITITYEIFDNTKYAHIVGNGTAPTNRSNAHTLDWDGNAWYAGNVTATKFIGDGSELTNLPHDDSKADKSEIPTTLPANGGNADTVDGIHADGLMQNISDWSSGDIIDLVLNAHSGVVFINNRVTGMPLDGVYWFGLIEASAKHRKITVTNTGGNHSYVRTFNNGTQTWSDWNRIGLTSQSITLSPNSDGLANVWARSENKTPIQAVAQNCIVQLFPSSDGYWKAKISLYSGAKITVATACTIYYI